MLPRLLYLLLLLLLLFSLLLLFLLMVFFIKTLLFVLLLLLLLVLPVLLVPVLLLLLPLSLMLLLILVVSLFRCNRLTDVVSRLGGVPDAGGGVQMRGVCRIHLLVLEVFVEKSLNYLKLFQNTFLCIGNRGKLFQTFSKVFSFLCFLQKCLYSSQVECRLVGGSISGGYAGIHV